ncbi:MAG: cytochrome c3 family protein [Nitrospirae bacterium]|nr:cytochrome c3 family protein [Nitrospirota bacterium]
MKRLLTIVLALAIAGIGSSAMAAVSGSPHDFTGVSTYTLCNPCHIPHAAKGSKRLWAQEQQGGGAIVFGDGATWATSDIGKLCGSCHHDGMAVIVASNAYGAGNQPHQVQASAYAAGSHGRSTTVLTGDLNDTPAAADNTGRPYLSTWGDPAMNNKIQCSTCHDPHDNTVAPFLRAIGAQASVTDVCEGCHDRVNGGYGTTNAMTRGANDGTSVASMHPVGITYDDKAGNENNGPLDLSKIGNTILRTQAELPAALRTPNPNTNNWRLGGKFEGGGSTGNLGCNTCHAVHGTNNGSLGGDAAPTNIYLLAVNNNGSNTNAPLCESCHGGSSTTAFTSLALVDGTAGSNGLHYVAGSQSAGVGVYDDHPLDMTPDGAPALVNWANAANARYERTAWGATSAGDPNAVAGRWPYGTVPGSPYVENGVSFGNIICISCHSAHNGISETSLRRKGGVALTSGGIATSNPTAAQMAANGGDIRNAWCYNCHQVQDMVPSFHHSTNTDVGGLGGTPANYTAGDIPGNSQIWCNDCHVGGGNLTAHNGFFNLALALPVTSNGSSDLCLGCHTGTDPVSGFSPPNGHVMNNAGTQSHYLGTFVDNAASTLDINVKRGAWRTVPYKGVNTAIYSKYGVTAASDATGGTDTHHTAAAAAWNANQTVVCESCHSVLFNAGWDTEVNGKAWDTTHSNWLVEGGWRTNLLLQLYEDRAPGTGNTADVPAYWGAGAGGPADVDGIDTGSGFCLQCHRQTDDVAGLIEGSIDAAGALDETLVPRNMHPMTGWTITRAVDSNRATTTLLTGMAAGYADAATSPDGGAGYVASYPKANGQDCDSCHRPHNAYGLIPNKPRTGSGVVDSVPAILETGNNSTNVDLVCVTCHDR